MKPAISRCTRRQLTAPQRLTERDGKALIDLVDGLSSGSVVLISVTDGDLADHDARLGGGAAERLSGHCGDTSCRRQSVSWQRRPWQRPDSFLKFKFFANGYPSLLKRLFFKFSTNGFPYIFFTQKSSLQIGTHVFFSQDLCETIS